MKSFRISISVGFIKAMVAMIRDKKLPSLFKKRKANGNSNRQKTNKGE